MCLTWQEASFGVLEVGVPLAGISREEVPPTVMLPPQPCSLRSQANPSTYKNTFPFKQIEIKVQYIKQQQQQQKEWKIPHLGFKRFRFLISCALHYFRFSCGFF